MTTAREISVREIVERLEDRLEELVERLLPGGRRVGNEWDCRGSKSPIGGAVAVVLKGHKRGAVGFFGGTSRQGGDILDLIEEVYGTDKRGAVEWAKGYLGIAENKPLPARPVTPRPTKVEDRARQARRQEDIAEIWAATRPLGGTHAEAYLRARGLSGAFGWPSVLRFHPGLEYTLGREEDEHGRLKPGPIFPALVARVEDHAGELRGLWRIYLDRQWPQKIDRDPAKVGMGEKKTHAVRFGEGRRIHLCEGIETGLAILEMIGNREPVWSCLDGGNIVNVCGALPPEVEAVVIWGDGDLVLEFPDGRRDQPGQRFARAGAEAARAIGRKAYLEPFPRGGDFLDVRSMETWTKAPWSP